MRLGGVVHLALGELRALVEEVDALRLRRRRRDRARGSSDPAPDSGGRRSRRARAAPTTRGGPGTACSARRSAATALSASPASWRRRAIWKQDRRRALHAVGADPVRVGVDRRQQLQRLLVARAQADHLAQALRGGVELLELFGEHAPEAQEQVGAPLGLGRPLQLQLVEAHHRAVVAERAVDLARRFDRLDVVLTQLAGALRVADALSSFAKWLTNSWPISDCSSAMRAGSRVRATAAASISSIVM